MESGQRRGGTRTLDDAMSEVAAAAVADLDMEAPSRMTLDEIDAADQRVSAAHALVPVPVVEEPPRKTTFWKRIALRRRARRRETSGIEDVDADDRLRDRLETMEGQLAAIEDSISVHFDQLEHRFTQLWEIEDALNQVVKLPEQLTEVGDRQKELARSVRSLEGRVRLLALLTLVLAGAVGALLAMSF